MLRLRRDSIKTKLMGLSILASASALLMACAGFLIFDSYSYRLNMARTLSTQADIVGFNSASALLFGDAGAAYQTLSALKARRATEIAGIYGKNGAPFAIWQRNGDGKASLPELPSISAATHRFNEGAMEIFYPLVFDGARVGTVYIRSSLDDLRRRRSQFLGIALAVLLVAMVASGLLSMQVGRRIADPVLTLADTMRGVSKTHDYSLRAVSQSTDEIGVFANTLNGMLDEIQASQAELRKSHEELEQRVRERTLELQASNSELEAFSYSVSHDLRTPLRSIDGFSLAVVEDFGDKLPDDGKEMLQRIRAATQTMGQLIDDMLNLGRITRTAMERETVDLSEMCRSIVESLRESNPKRRVQVDIAEGAVVNADPRLLRVALENLLSNAWKFTSRQTDARIEFGQRPHDGTTAYYVRDNGAGFDMTYVNKLFRPFQRLHAQADFKGTGVGLATVHRVITRHGGQVWAESEPGKGATFFFVL